MSAFRRVSFRSGRVAFDPLLWWRGPWRAFIVQVECHVRGPCVAQGTPGGSGSARHDHEAAAARSRPGQHDSGSGVVSRRVAHRYQSRWSRSRSVRWCGCAARFRAARGAPRRGPRPGRTVFYDCSVKVRKMCVNVELCSVPAVRPTWGRLDPLSQPGRWF